MQTYPATPVPSFSYVQGIQFKTIISQFENLAEQRRQKWSQGKRTFSLTYPVLSSTDMDTLWNFYVARNGSYDAFTFVDPISSTSYTVRFQDDSLSREEFAYRLEKIGIKLIQVF